MDKSQAIHSFWSSFGLVAYDEASVPSGDDMPDFPYISYGVATDSMDNVLPLAGSLWYRDTSWKDISIKAEEIAEFIEKSHRPIKISGGYLWINKGVPFAQRMSDPDDSSIRRILINIEVEFLTEF